MKNLVLPAVAAGLFFLAVLVWPAGSRNPESPAGYVGYLTQGAVYQPTPVSPVR